MKTKKPEITDINFHNLMKEINVQMQGQQGVLVPGKIE